MAGTRPRLAVAGSYVVLAERVMSVTHVAGLPVTMHGIHVRQRCAWCGAIIEDQDLTRMAAPIGQQSSAFPTWEVGVMVRIDGGCYSTVDGDKMPEDACGMLPPEITDGSIHG